MNKWWLVRDEVKSNTKAVNEPHESATNVLLFFFATAIRLKNLFPDASAIQYGNVIWKWILHGDVIEIYMSCQSYAAIRILS